GVHRLGVSTDGARRRGARRSPNGGRSAGAHRLGCRVVDGVRGAALARARACAAGTGRGSGGGRGMSAPTHTDRAAAYAPGEVPRVPLVAASMPHDTVLRRFLARAEATPE